MMSLAVFLLGLACGLAIGALIRPALLLRWRRIAATRWAMYEDLSKDYNLVHNQSSHWHVQFLKEKAANDLLQKANTGLRKRAEESEAWNSVLENITEIGRP